MSIKKILLSAVQPTSHLTLGNYLGAMKHWVKFQDDYDCLFIGVDLHAITLRQDPNELRKATYRAIATYIAAGLAPKKNRIFVQSHVPHHAELAWILTCHASMGELGRMVQFKEKSSQQGENIPAGLFCYPLLMAADILLYQTDLVPVGADQKQHVELTRDLAVRMRHLYGEDLFKIPEMFIPPIGSRIMSLQNPLVKMSKSDPDPHACIFLNDSDDVIRKKIKRAVTDSGTEITYDDQKLGIKNLLTLQAAITGNTIDSIVSNYQGKQYGHLKVETAEIVVETIRPLRERTEELLKDISTLDQTLKEGAERATAHAEKTLKIVYDRVGFVAR